jgi:hypothetical protein
VFAVSMRGTQTNASFELSGVKGSAEFEVIGENRTVKASAGTFGDRFEGYAVHLYRTGS